MACGSQATSPGSTYVQEVKDWQKERIAGLMAPDSWLALAGLFWLEPGENTFGSALDHPVIFPATTPANLGSFFLLEDSVHMQIQAGYQVEVGGQPFTSLPLTGQDTTPLVHFQDLKWTLIQRNQKYGIRLWDAGQSSLQDTVQIDAFPIDPAWRLKAQLVPDTTGHTVTYRNVLDMEMDLETEGRLQFQHQGKHYELTALDGGEEQLFIIFADATTGDQTYGGGRYLYADRADSSGYTYVDFNKAYNPPCVFTEFATCLLPPAENRLDLFITAGERAYGHH